jgi:putative hydrolase of the HAD superfamily
MSSPEPDSNGIEAIFFDMNGTLRMRVPDERWQRQSVESLLALLGKPGAPASFLDELSSRYQAYTRWADENETSLPESGIWTRWLTPELPHEHLKAHSVELTLAFRNRKGRSILKPDTAVVLSELRWRGYRLGIISNSTSTADIPRFIEECNLKELFEVVILSSLFGIRKPSTGIFMEATRRMHVDPARCAYIGNKIAVDIVGAHRAGFGMAIFVTPGNVPLTPEKDPVEKPDLIIHELIDLLDVFPPRSQK